MNKIKIMTVVGTRPEIIKLSQVMKELDEYTDHTIVHTGQNYDYELNELFFEQLEIRKPDIFLEAIKGTSSETIGDIIAKSDGVFKNLKPDLLIVLGDRYEILASTISAHLCRIPVAHIHGGELTQGTIDDAFRHSITKMSHIHFVANAIYKKRVIQLGESPQNVHVVGGLGIDSISKTNLLAKNELEKKFNFKFNKTNFLVNFHPETLNKNLAKKQIRELLSALGELKDVGLILGGKEKIITDTEKPNLKKLRG